MIHSPHHPKSEESIGRLSDDFRTIGRILEHESVSLAQILKLLHGRGQALLILFLALPFCLPIPLPGLSFFFGLIIATLGISLATGYPPWLPKSWMERPLPTTTLSKICTSGQKILARVEHIIKPRFTWVHSFRVVRMVNGSIITCCALLLALPLPPGTNFPPALSILLIAIGTLELDGLILGFGYGMFVLNLLMFGSLAFYGFDAVQKFLI